MIPKPCPFCGSLRIAVYEDKQKKGIMRGANYIYAFCHACAARGAHIYSDDLEDDEDKEKLGMERWNERQGEQ